MSRISNVHAGLVAAGLLGLLLAGKASAQEALSIDVLDLKASGCMGLSYCALDGAAISTFGGALGKKGINGATGIGVTGGRADNEIDIGQTLRIDLDDSRNIVAIQFLFLYNGPEFGERAEVASVIADDVAYTLSIRNDADDAGADWSGPGTVTKCGAATLTGTGCFLVTDPFPGAVNRVDFSAVAAGPSFPEGTGTSESDYSIGFIDIAARDVFDLVDCAGPEGCPVVTVDGHVAFSLNSVQVENPGGSTEALVKRVSLPDCRYIPQVCLNLLPPAGDSAESDDAARAMLINLGVIKSVEPSGPNTLSPAVQLLNIKPLLPPDVTELFDVSGTPPTGLPAMYVAREWRAQAVNGHWFDGFFFKTDPAIRFAGVFEGRIDVSLLTGDELGCVANPGNLLAWDVITTVSELARGAGGQHGDTMINVGCINPTKVAGTRLSLYSVNLEVVPDTYGPTIKTSSPKVTLNNDAVFARLVESLWKGLGDTRVNFACKQADPLPAGGIPPLSKQLCDRLATLAKSVDNKIKLCVNATFQPANAQQVSTCTSAKQSVESFEAALPAVATGPDLYNRLGELKARVDVLQHVWDERFLLSIKPGGFCRERGTCPP